MHGGANDDRGRYPQTGAQVTPGAADGDGVARHDIDASEFRP